MEIWLENDEKPSTELCEGAAGSYKGSVTFTDSGSYHITVHVEKEDIHKHEEFIAEVED